MRTMLSVILAAAALAAPLGADVRSATDAQAVAAYGAGVDRLDRSDFKGAESDFKRAIALKPDYAEAYDKLGLSLCDRGRPMRATADLKLATAIDPRLTAAWYDLGRAFETMDQDVLLKNDPGSRRRLLKTERVEAIAAYRKALEVSPPNDVRAEAYAHFRLGVLLRDRALRAWDLAHAAGVTGTPAEQPTLDKANLKEAMLHFEAANALKPDFPENRNELGRLYDVIGRYPEAIHQFNRAISERPGFAAAYSNRGVAWWHSGNWDRALADTLKATEVDPLFAGGHYNFAEVLFAHVQVLRISATGKDRSLIHLEARKAIDEYTRAVQLDPAFMPAWYGLARAYRGYFDFKDAQKTYEKILALDKRQRRARLEMRAMLRQQAGYFSQIPRAYRPTPTPTPQP